MNTFDFSFTEYESWLLTHIDNMACPDDTCRRAFDLKRIHSLKVAKEIVEIGRRMQLNRQTLFLSGIIGLLHDVGRFEQFKTYRTFNDYLSVDHGDLGARTIEANGALKQLHAQEKKVVVKAIRWHNKMELPDDTDAQALFYAQLLRDADKLDIYRVVAENILRPDRPEPLPPAEDISEALYADLMAGRRVCYKDIRGSTEMRMMQLNWITDINFKPTLDLIVERKYLDLIAGSLPKTEKIKACVGKVMCGLKERL